MGNRSGGFEGFEVDDAEDYQELDRSDDERITYIIERSTKMVVVVFVIVGADVGIGVGVGIGVVVIVSDDQLISYIIERSTKMVGMYQTRPMRAKLRPHA